MQRIKASKKIIFQSAFKYGRFTLKRIQRCWDEFSMPLECKAHSKRGNFILAEHHIYRIFFILKGL